MSNQKIMDVFSIQNINNMLYLESSPAQNIGLDMIMVHIGEMDRI